MTRTYRVRPGFRFGAQNQHAPGDVVELEEAAALGFLDKLELVQEVEAPPVVEVTETPEAPGEKKRARK